MDGNGTHMKKVNRVSVATVIQGTRERNKLELERMARKLKDLLREESLVETAIAITGSDARLEKGHFSESELIVFANQNGDTKSAEILRSHGFDVEIKIIGSETLSFYEGKRNTVFPQRVYDSVVLVGNPDVFVEAKRRLVSEWKEIRGIKEEIKRKKAEYRIALNGEQNWKGCKVRNYDLETGEAYYFDDTETGARIRSFKNGPLRFVQFAVTNSLISSIKARTTEAGVRIMEEIPTNTSDRIEFLRSVRVLDLEPAEARAMVEIYEHFLCAYHISEWESKKGRRTTAVDIVETRERIIELEKIIEGMGIIQ